MKQIKVKAINLNPSKKRNSLKRLYWDKMFVNFIKIKDIEALLKKELMACLSVQRIS